MEPNFIVTSDRCVIDLNEYHVPFCVSEGGAAYVPFPERVLRKLFDIIHSHKAIDDSEVTEEEYDQMVTFASAINADRRFKFDRYNLHACGGLDPIFTGYANFVKALKKGDTRPIDFMLHDYMYTSMDDPEYGINADESIIIVDESRIDPDLVVWLTTALQESRCKLLYLANGVKELVTKLPLDCVDIIAVQSAEPMDVDHPGYIHVPMKK